MLGLKRRAGQSFHFYFGEEMIVLKLMAVVGEAIMLVIEEKGETKKLQVLENATITISKGIAFRCKNIGGTAVDFIFKLDPLVIVKRSELVENEL